MKKFIRIEPTTKQYAGLQYKWAIIIKRFRTDDGTEHEFTTIGREGEHAGAVIAITPDKKVVSTYQFRAGPERWMYDIPGGLFNEGEEAVEGALRELQEETGYKPGRVEFLGVSSRDTYSNITYHYFLATDCEPDQGGPQLDKEEREQGAEVRLISIEQLIENAKNDEMTDPHAVLMAYEKLLQLNSLSNS